MSIFLWLSFICIALFWICLFCRECGKISEDTSTIVFLILLPMSMLMSILSVATITPITDSPEFREQARERRFKSQIAMCKWKEDKDKCRMQAEIRKLQEEVRELRENQ